MQCYKYQWRDAVSTIWRHLKHNFPKICIPTLDSVGNKTHFFLLVSFCCLYILCTAHILHIYIDGEMHCICTMSPSLFMYSLYFMHFYRWISNSVGGYFIFRELMVLLPIASVVANRKSYQKKQGQSWNKFILLRPCAQMCNLYIEHFAHSSIVQMGNCANISCAL